MTDTYIIRTPISGVVLIERPVFTDDRGFFHEIERRTELESAVRFDLRHAQWNHSRSRKSVLRGIHVAQWNKCVYTVRGTAQIAVCDLRPESRTFGQHVSYAIGERRRVAVFIPAGCGNSFLALTGLVDYMYSVDSVWYPDGEYGIAWNDPDLAIDWKIKRPLLSERDQSNPTLRERFPAWFDATRVRGSNGMPALVRSVGDSRPGDGRAILVGSSKR